MRRGKNIILSNISMFKQLQRSICCQTYLVFIGEAHFCHVYGEVVLVGHDNLYFLNLKDNADVTTRVYAPVCLSIQLQSHCNAGICCVQNYR